MRGTDVGGKVSRADSNPERVRVVNRQIKIRDKLHGQTNVSTNVLSNVLSTER